MLFSLVIPVYNTNDSLAEIVQRCVKVFSTASNYSFEIIFVDDRSTNVATWPRLKALVAENRNVSAFRLGKNSGQQAALLCGMSKAKGEFIITLDDDLQHNPLDIAKFFPALKHDVLIAGFRIKSHSLIKTLASQFKDWIAGITLGKPSGLTLSPFRCIRRPIVDHILNIQTPYPFVTSAIFSATHDVVNIELEHHARSEGQSGYGVISSMKLASILILNNSSVLLRTILWFALTVLGLSILASIYLAGRYLMYGSSVPGWNSLILSISFFGSASLVVQGIIGEYLVRILITSEKRKPYYISESASALELQSGSPHANNSMA